MSVLSERDLLLDLKRHGFTQLRKTNHGYLWGFKEFRFQVPSNYGEGSMNRADQNACAQWNNLKERMYGELPGLKARVIARALHNGHETGNGHVIEPVRNPEDTLPVVGTTAIAVVTPNEPSPPESAPVASSSWTCPKCGQTFKQHGKHPLICTGTPPTSAQILSRARGARYRARHTDRLALPPATETATDPIEAFTRAREALLKQREALVTERDMLTARIAAIDAALGKGDA